MWFFIRCVIQDAAYQTRGIILHPGCDGAGRRLASSISDSLSSSFKKKKLSVFVEKNTSFRVTLPSCLLDSLNSNHKAAC